MARSIEVYPKVVLDGSTWTLTVKVIDKDARTQSKFVHTFPAAVSGTGRLLKLSVDMTVPDTETDQDISDAIVSQDIKPGPQTETVWGNWQDRAEASWPDPLSKPDTAKTRNDLRTLASDRSWTPTYLHQHEGDGTVTEESA